MKRLFQMMPLVVVFVALFSLYPQKAHAYIDPGTGSMIIQILIAGFLGASFAVKAYWKKIKAFIVSRSSKGQGGADGGN
jgi:hypothetical protein